MPVNAARAKARMRAMRRLRDISRDQKGATAVEYGLIVGLVFLGIVSGVALLAGTTTGMWNNVSSEVRDAQS
jgi:pilus assembly protein Flp/PilA